jgi:hypothetical protein
VKLVRPIMASALALSIPACTFPQIQPPPPPPSPPPSVEVSEEQVVGTWKIRHSSKGTLIFDADHTVSMIDVSSGVVINSLMRRQYPLSGEGNWRITGPYGRETGLRDTVVLRFETVSDGSGPREFQLRAIKPDDVLMLTRGVYFVKTDTP